MTIHKCYLIFVFLTCVALLSGCYTLEKQDYEYCHIVNRFQTYKPPPCSQTKRDEYPQNLEVTSISQAIDQALCYQPDVDIALARIRQAEAAIGEANAAFLPVISTRSSFLVADAPSAYFFKMIDARTLNPQIDFNNPGSFTNFETDLSLQYQLFRGGRNILQKWAAEKEVSIKCLDSLTLYNALTASVIDSYYSALAFREALDVVKASKETTEKQLKKTENRYEEGAVLKSDVLLLQVRLAENEEEIIQAQNAYLLAIASLANLLGGNADTPILIEEDVDFHIPQPDNYDSALAMAMCCRPELLSARNQVEIAGIDVSMKKRAFLPEVDILSKVYWDDEHMHYHGDRTNWLASIDFNWSIFEGGRKCYALRKSCSLFQEMLAYDRKVALGVQLDIKQAYLRLEHAASRFETAKVAIEHAKASLNEVTVQYQEGVRTVSDFLEAQLMLTKANLRKIQASYDLKKSQAEVARAVGLLVSSRISEGCYE